MPPKLPENDNSKQNPTKKKNNCYLIGDYNIQNIDQALKADTIISNQYQIKSNIQEHMSFMQIKEGQLPKNIDENDIVIISSGTNDLYSTKTEDIADTINIIGQQPCRTIVISIPPQDCLFINKNVIKLNTFIKHQCVKHNNINIINTHKFIKNQHICSDGTLDPETKRWISAKIIRTINFINNKNNSTANENSAVQSTKKKSYPGLGGMKAPINTTSYNKKNKNRYHQNKKTYNKDYLDLNKKCYKSKTVSFQQQHTKKQMGLKDQQKHHQQQKYQNHQTTQEQQKPKQNNQKPVQELLKQQDSQRKKEHNEEQQQRQQHQHQQHQQKEHHNPNHQQTQKHHPPKEWQRQRRMETHQELTSQQYTYIPYHAANTITLKPPIPQLTPHMETSNQLSQQIPLQSRAYQSGHLHRQWPLPVGPSPNLNLHCPQPPSQAVHNPASQGVTTIMPDFYLGNQLTQSTQSQQIPMLPNSGNHIFDNYRQSIIPYCSWV